MEILVNKKIKSLLIRILLSILAFVIVSVALMRFVNQNAAIYVFLCSLCMAAAILIFCYRYFLEQHEIIETATAQISDYISGDPNARIQCDEEGELNRLFHEVNSLASILNAHAEK